MKKKDAPAFLNWLVPSLFGLAVLGMFSVMAHRAYREVKMSSPEWKTKFQENFPGLEAAAGLTAKQRRLVIQRANAEKCACRCGYTVAACLKLDTSYPNRPANLQRIKDMVDEIAGKPR